MTDTLTIRSATTLRTKFSLKGGTPARRILLNGFFLALASIGVFVALLVRVLQVGGVNAGLFFALGILCSTMFLVRALYLRPERFMFSPTFWLLVTIFFYFVLRSIDLWFKDQNNPTVVEALWLCTLFLVTYAFVFALMDARLRYVQPKMQREQVIAPRAALPLLAVYLIFKILGIALFASVGGGNVLEMASVTQNAGAAYLYRLPVIANIIFLALLFNSFKNNRNWKITKLALIFYLLEAILTTSRLALIMVVFWWAFLHHRYRRPISMLRLTLIGLPLVLTLALFGYARNIEVGSVTAYVEAASVLADRPALVSDLFMQRLDMLPQLVDALGLLHEGLLSELYGASYIYTFLHAVPRSIWEAKPLLTAALATSATQPGAFADGVNIFPSILFEGMLNLSYLGVILSAALVAVFSRLLERAVEADRLVPSVWALSMLTFPMALFNEGFHSNFTGNFLYATAVSALLYSVFKALGLIQSRRALA